MINCAIMTRGQAIGLAGATVLGGSALIVYLLRSVSPLLADGQLNMAALALFFGGLLIVVGGIGSLIALALHNRWPFLAGVRSRRVKPDPAVAIRQGALLALGVAVLGLLALWHVLDIAFILVALVLVGLLEAFLQSRQR